MKEATRRRFLWTVAGTVLAGAAGAASCLAEPYFLQVTRTRVILPGRKMAGPLRILHLSDFHAPESSPLRLTARAIGLGLAEKPDLICLTGDFITWNLTEREEYVRQLRRLSAAAPTYAVLGNHDGGRWAGNSRGYKTTEKVEALLKEASVRLLVNQSETISVRGTELELAGMGDMWAGLCRPEGVLSPQGEEGERMCILMSHNPDSKEIVGGHAWDLMLCGHTHGGQVDLPFLGRPFLPVRDRRFAEGLHAWEGRQIFITRGVGSLHGIRLNCRPEVSLLDLAPV